VNTLHKPALLLLGACVCFAFANARAEERASEYFNPKINTWAEGVILSIDADAAKFSIRGARKAYSTTYARMMRDIDAKTKNLNGDARDAKAAEVRAAWADKLAATQKEKSGADGDFTFSLPGKDAAASVYDERGRYGDKRDRNPNEAVQTKLSVSEAQALKTLKEFKVGDVVVVGYESGVVYNTAWAIVRVSERSLQTENPPAEKEAEAASDVELTRQIRRAIVTDTSLSVGAHNVNIQTQNGSVVLKGEVKNEAEKNAVAAKATSIVGQGKVDCQLSVAER